MRRSRFVLLAIGLSLMTSAVLEAGPADARRERCAALARRNAEQARREGVRAERVELLLQTEMAVCAGVPREEARIVAEYNSDLARLARMFLTGGLSSEDYLLRVWDRGRKLRRARTERVSATALEVRDRDLDRVPDSLDRCPGTPQLEPTDDTGCPHRNVRMPPAPNADRLRRELESLEFAVNPACDGAPEPREPQPLRYGRNINTGFKLVAADVSGSQPPGCKLLYDIRVRLSAPTGAPQFPGGPPEPPVSYVQVVYDAAEDLEPNPREAVFAVSQNGPVESRSTLFRQLGHYKVMQWKVRAVYGNGVSSDWSPWITSKPESSGIP